MTKDEAIKKVIDLAKSQVGTKEGTNNWNPYAADPLMTQAYGMNMQNQPWCAIFVNWLFIHSFSLPIGKEMTYGCSATCYTQADMYLYAGAFNPTPHLGDQVFYTTGAGHTGLVVNITNEYFDAVEGNYSDKVSLVRHSKNGSEIYGFGVPNWELVADEPADDEDQNDDIIHPDYRRSYYHLQYGDGIATKEHPNVKPLPQVRAWQWMLVCWGYEKDLGESGADGEFGKCTKEATEAWQKKAKSMGADVEVNGIVDEDDWIEIINVEA